MRRFKLRLLEFALLVLVTSCGSGNENPAPLDLGGGLSMTADGAILGATELRPADRRVVEDVQ